MVLAVISWREERLKWAGLLLNPRADSELRNA